MKIPTQILGMVPEGAKFEIFAITQNSVIEIELREEQKYRLTKCGQTYIQFPEDIVQVEFKLDDQLERVKCEKETRVLYIPFFKPHAKDIAKETQLTPEGREELILAIRKSLPSDSNLYEDGDNYHSSEDEDDFDLYEYEYSGSYNKKTLEILVNSQDFQNRFYVVQEAFSQHFEKVQFDFNPTIIESIQTDTDEDRLELVIDVAIDSESCELRLFFEGDGSYFNPGQRIPSTQLAFSFAWLYLGFDELHTEKNDSYPSTVYWSGGGEYYDEDGNLAEKPDFYTQLELVLPTINQAFAGYKLHPEFALDNETARAFSEERRRFFEI